jgi:hypothetical protein
MNRRRIKNITVNYGANRFPHMKNERKHTAISQMGGSSEQTPSEKRH